MTRPLPVRALNGRRRSGRTTTAVITLGGVVLAGAVLAGCGAGAGGSDSTTTSPIASTVADSDALLAGRLRAIVAAVGRWRSAVDLPAARAAAEAARNLVVGAAGPAFGDADGDGVISGDATAGVLPGLHGEPGLAQPGAGACVVRDVLGGDWSNPEARWATLAEAIAAWRPANNTFPSLPSHPQRLIGWATLTLQTHDLATALEFGGHAQLHADISLRAITACSG